MERLSTILTLMAESFTKLLIPCLQITLPVTAISFIIGCLLALALALVQIANVKGLKQFARFYIWIFRGTPLILQLYIIYFGLPSIGINIDAIPAAIIGFSLNLAAYNSEIIRSAIQSVPQGQIEAAQMIGLNYFQTMVRVVLPQAAKVAFPPLFSSLIGLTKDTSLASSITVVEMMQVAKQIAARYYEPFAMYIEAGIIYLMVCTVLTKLQNYMEKKLEVKQPEEEEVKQIG